MERCKTCKHWQMPDTNGYGENQPLNVCAPWDLDAPEGENGHSRRELLNPRIRQCVIATHLTWVNHSDPPQPADGVFVGDAEDYAAWMLTAEDFGCVRHEPAADTTPPQKG
jgi:hypothetical protein